MAKTGMAASRWYDYIISIVIAYAIITIMAVIWGNVTDKGIIEILTRSVKDFSILIVLGPSQFDEVPNDIARLLVMLAGSALFFLVALAPFSRWPRMLLLSGFVLAWVLSAGYSFAIFSRKFFP